MQVLQVLIHHNLELLNGTHGGKSFVNKCLDCDNALLSVVFFECLVGVEVGIMVTSLFWILWALQNMLVCIVTTIFQTPSTEPTTATLVAAHKCKAAIKVKKRLAAPGTAKCQFMDYFLAQYLRCSFIRIANLLNSLILPSDLLLLVIQSTNYRFGCENLQFQLLLRDKNGFRCTSFSKVDHFDRTFTFDTRAHNLSFFTATAKTSIVLQGHVVASQQTVPACERATFMRACKAHLRVNSFDTHNAQDPLHQRPI